MLLTCSPESGPARDSSRLERSGTWTAEVQPLDGGLSVVSIMAHRTAKLVTPSVARLFWPIVKTFRAASAAVALVGLALGVWAVGFAAAGDWVLVRIGLGCLLSYIGLLSGLAIMLYTGRWAKFCDWAHSQFVAEFTGRDCIRDMAGALRRRHVRISGFEFTGRAEGSASANTIALWVTWRFGTVRRGGPSELGRS